MNGHSFAWNSRSSQLVAYAFFTCTVLGCSVDAPTTVAAPAPSADRQAVQGFDSVLSRLRPLHVAQLRDREILGKRGARFHDTGLSLEETIRDVEHERLVAFSSAASAAADTFAILYAGSVAKLIGDQAVFKSYTITNRVGVRYVHAAEWTLGFIGGPAIASFMRTDNVLVNDRDNWITDWPSIYIPPTCPLSASINTDHTATYPGSYLTPRLVSVRLDKGSIDGDQRSVACNHADDGPPVLCDNEYSTDGCAPAPPQTPRAPGTQGGDTIRREFHDTGVPGRKLVCIVTDWYINGIYSDTTVDSCWLEPY